MSEESSSGASNTSSMSGAAPEVEQVEPAAQSVVGELRPIWPAPPTPQRVSGGRWSFAARVAATLGGLFFFFGAWIPWAAAITSGDLNKGVSGPHYRLYVTPAEVGAPPFLGAVSANAFALWSLFTALGLLLTPFFWQRTRAWLVWVSAILYGLWAALGAATLYQTGVLLFQTIPAQSSSANGPYTTTLYPFSERLAFYTTTPSAGGYITGVALVLALVALILAVVAIVTSPPSFRTHPQTVYGEVATGSIPAEPVESSRPIISIRPARRSLPGAGAVTGGLLLWLWGYFWLPWATQNCNQSPLLAGQCSGLPGFGTLPLGLYNTSSLFDPAVAFWAANGLLLVGALIALLGVWSREITRTLAAWLSGWLVFATACSLVALHGVQLAVLNPTSVGLTAGGWRGSLGTLVVFLGLLLVFIGLAPLWALAIRTAPRREPPTE